VKSPDFIAVLKTMRLEGAKIMISDNTNKQKYATNAVVSFGNIPHQIRSDHGVDSRLAGFPVSLLYSQIADPELDKETAKFLLMMCAFDSARLLADKQLCKKVRAVWYYADPASYIEDEHIRQMQYKSRKASEYSVTVAWNKNRGRWETGEYRGYELVRYAFGEDYNTAMLRTTAFAPGVDEAFDVQ
jgi:hypothetical protein